MVIHHDKMAYGKLDDLTEKFGEDKLARMARMLSVGEAEESADGEEPEKGGTAKASGKAADSANADDKANKAGE